MVVSKTVFVFIPLGLSVTSTMTALLKIDFSDKMKDNTVKKPIFWQIQCQAYFRPLSLLQFTSINSRCQDLVLHFGVVNYLVLNLFLLLRR